jgi:hypothetical protein
MAMASLASVTVSMAALIMGMFSRIRFVNKVETSTSLGNIDEYAGTNKTSSKVNPSFPNFSANSNGPFPPSE